MFSPTLVAMTNGLIYVRQTGYVRVCGFRCWNDRRSGFWQAAPRLFRLNFMIWMAFLILVWSVSSAEEFKEDGILLKFPGVPK
jgi:hypothetical protein